MTGLIRPQPERVPGSRAARLLPLRLLPQLRAPSARREQEAREEDQGLREAAGALREAVVLAAGEGREEDSAVRPAGHSDTASLFQADQPAG